MKKIIKQAADCFHEQPAACFYIDFCSERMYV